MAVKVLGSSDPLCAGPNPIDLGPVNRVAFGNLLARNSGAFQGQNVPDLLIRKHGAWVVGAMKGRAPSFAHPIRNVVSVGAQEQVGWVHTGWHIALVKDVEPVLDWPLVEFIGDPVGALELPGPSSNLDLWVSVLVGTGRTEPAARDEIGLDLLHQPGHDRLGLAHV